MIALDLHTFFGLPMAAICSLLSTSFGAREPIFKCAFSDNGVSFRRRWWCLHRQGVDRACVDGSNAGILVCLCQELPNTTCPSPSPASLPSLLETTISGANVRGNLSTRDQFNYFVGLVSCYCRRVELRQTAVIREHIKNYGGRRWWRLRYLSGILQLIYDLLYFIRCSYLSGFFKGTSTDQDRRFSDKQLKLLKTLKFPPEFEKKVCIQQNSVQCSN